MFNIHLLPASFGDSILIEYGDGEPHYVLIDGGPYFAMEPVLQYAKKVAPGLKTLELLVITHIDIDHIDGIIVMLNQPKPPLEIKEVWFNGFKEISGVKEDDILGVLQGEMLSVLIERHKLPHNLAFGGKAIMVRDYQNLPVYMLDGGLELTLVAPGAKALLDLKPKWQDEINDIGDEAAVAKRLAEDHRYDNFPDDLLGEPSLEDWQNAPEIGDKTPTNGSSIAFIARYGKRRCLLAGDSPAHHLMAALEPLRQKEGTLRLKLDAWKLAHHGSKKSTLSALMEMIECPRLLFSSDGKRYKHPNKECVAKIIKYLAGPKVLYFNYKTDFNDLWENPSWQQEYNYSVVYPDGEGLSISLEK